MIKLKEKKKLKNNISKKLKKIRKNLWDQSKKGFNYFDIFILDWEGWI